MTSWIRSDGVILLPTPKYHIEEEHDNYKTKMKLKIMNLEKKDFGSYKCVAKNTLGEKEGLVRLYGMKFKDNFCFKVYSVEDFMIFFNFATDIPISTHRSVGNNVMESMRHKSNEILVNYFSLLFSKHKKKFLYLKFYF
jgi:hypothetical protein